MCFIYIHGYKFMFILVQKFFNKPTIERLDFNSYYRYLGSNEKQTWNYKLTYKTPSIRYHNLQVKKRYKNIISVIIIQSTTKL